MKIIKRLYWRANAIIGYLVLLPIDYMVSKTTDQTWYEAHGITMKAVMESWNKY